MQNLENVYYHGINPLGSSFGSYIEKDDLYESLKDLRKILKSGYIYSLRNQGITNVKKASLAGLDQICICKDMRKLINLRINYDQNPHDAYSSFVLDCYSIVLNSDIPNAIKPKLVAQFEASMEKNDTDLFDEWRVKDKIDIKQNAVGIGVPFLAISSYLTKKNLISFKRLQEELKYQYDCLKNFLVALNYNLPIIDTELKKEINNLDSLYFENLEEQIRVRKILDN